MNKKLLKELLRIPSHVREENLLTDWLMAYFNSRHDCAVRRDKMGNVYVTKGIQPPYPCVCAHLDTVHPLTNYLIQEEGDTLYAVDWTEQRVGCGGDDKAGVYLCLRMLDRYPSLKAAFFVQEEIGCQGSRAADPQFFTDVGYVIEFDSPCDDILSFTCDGVRLFPLEGPFYEAVYPQLQKFGVLNWQHHPYTDVSILKRRFPFPCLNLPAGYFRMHSSLEYVQMAAVENTEQLAVSLIDALGCCVYSFRVIENGAADHKSPVLVTYLKTHDYEKRVPVPPSTEGARGSIENRLRKLGASQPKP
jgi:hypothetical protein